MTTQLIKHERIKTTWAKAMELRRPAEKVRCFARQVDVCGCRGAMQREHTQGWSEEGEMVVVVVVCCVLVSGQSNLIVQTSFWCGIGCASWDGSVCDVDSPPFPHPSDPHQMITLAKQGTAHSKKFAGSWVQEEGVLPKLFETLGPRYANRSGGYTRVLKAGNRLGDQAPMAYIEFVDNELPPLRAPKKKRSKDEAAAAFKQTGIILRNKRQVAQEGARQALSSHFPRGSRKADHHSTNPMKSQDRL
jgi:ribosomal protein L17